MRKKNISVSIISYIFILIFALSSNINAIQVLFAPTYQHQKEILSSDFEKEKEKEKESSGKDGKVKDDFCLQKSESEYLKEQINKFHSFGFINWSNLSLPPSIPPPEFRS